MISSNTFIRAALVLGCFAAVLPAAEEALPPAEKILERSIEVTGGKAAYEKVKSTVTTIKMTLPAQNMSANITSYLVTPKKHYVMIEMPGMGVMEEGSDGVVAWSKNPMMGPRLKEGEEKEMAFRSNTFDKDARWREFYTKAETVGIETVDGKPAYKVVMTPTVGGSETRLYDKESGLPVRLITTQKTAMGEMPSEISMSEFKKTGDITSPTKMQMKAAGQEMEMRIEKIEYNVAIPDSKFALPADIQALVDKKNGAAPKPAAAVPAEKK